MYMHGMLKLALVPILVCAADIAASLLSHSHVSNFVEHSLESTLWMAPCHNGCQVLCLAMLCLRPQSRHEQRAELSVCPDESLQRHALACAC